MNRHRLTIVLHQFADVQTGDGRLITMPNRVDPATIPTGFSEVVVTEDMWADVLELDTWAFPAPQSPEELIGWPSPLDFSRVRGLRAANHSGLAAMHASYGFSKYPVPGATMEAAGLTWVGVHPQFRRRGLLRSMINTHLADCRERGEAISALTASEPAIYGRFGYGLAATTLALTLPRGADLRWVEGCDDLDITIETFNLTKHAALVADLHARCGAGPINRPGWVTRESEELQTAYLHDPESLRDGYEARRIMIASAAGSPTGYALFRRKIDWSPEGPQGSVAVAEAVGLNPASVHALWSRLLDFDLTRRVTVSTLPIDDPLVNLLVDLRAARATLSDNQWVRIVDLASALCSRRYPADLDVTISITDALIESNAGNWRLQVHAFSDQIEVTRAETAEIGLDITALGSLYLGGVSATALAAAGQITGDPLAIGRLSAAFSWQLSPGSNWHY